LQLDYYISVSVSLPELHIIPNFYIGNLKTLR